MQLKKTGVIGIFMLGALGGTLWGQDVLKYAVPKGWAEVAASMPLPESYDQISAAVQAQMQTLGQVLEVRDMPQNALKAWLVQAPNGKRMTLYTTADGKNIFTGAVWDLASKQNINQVFAVPPAAAVPTQTGPQVQEVAPNPGQALLGKFTGEIPPAIQALETLGGPKIGSGGPGETLYVIIDPRCPYCHQAYEGLKPYMDKGVTVKWIPTVALGNSEKGLPLANAVLHAKGRAELDQIMSNPEAHGKPLTGSDPQVLQRNLQFMFQAFEQNGGQAGVPVTFFVDKNNGQARMMMGLSEEVVIQTILGPL